MDSKEQKGGIAINYMFLLVLGVLILMILIGFNIFLGDKAKDLMDSLNLPIF